MKGYDAFAGVIKSGGKTRRAAKMVILNVDHPDVVEFINCKVEEERKAWTLIEAGYDPSFNGPAYSSVFFQNSNNSVRVKDDFMKAVEEDAEWHTYAVTTGQIMDTYRARDLARMMADAAWSCGDPGLQYHGTVNHWHTCPNTDRLNASNPCSALPPISTPLLRVRRRPPSNVDHITPGHGPLPLLTAAHEPWNTACERGAAHGFRNAQATVIAPTGTIGFMMDCDTTGIEPDIALVKYKKLVGGGMLKIVNQTVPIALRRLGYSEPQVSEILQYIDEQDTIEGAPHLRPDDLPVFDCAFKPATGSRSIHYMGHVKMMASAQPVT